MCVVTNPDNIVVSVSLIPGVDPIPEVYNVYFPVVGDLPCVGDYYKPEE